jgi:hypothetical protein
MYLAVTSVMFLDFAFIIFLLVTKIFRPLKLPQDCSLLQIDVEASMTGAQRVR